MLKKLIKEAEERVINLIRDPNRYASNGKLRKREKYFCSKLSEIWEEDIAEENKFDDEDVFQHALAVIYLLYCYPTRHFSDVIKDTKQIYEYWDFFLDQYPNITFNLGIHGFYQAVKKIENKR